MLLKKVKECIHIDNELQVYLSFEGLPIPLPEYIKNSAHYKLISLDMLTNLPITHGAVYWTCQNRFHEHDLKECAKFRKTPKINYSVLHPGIGATSS